MFGGRPGRTFAAASTTREGRPMSARRTVIALLSLVLVLSAAWSAGPAVAFDQLIAPDVVAPMDGATIAAGSAVTFRVSSGPGDDYLWVHISHSPAAAETCGTIGSDVGTAPLDATVADPTLYEATPTNFESYSFWLNRPGTYYWQAFRFRWRRRVHRGAGALADRHRHPARRDRPSAACARRRGDAACRPADLPGICHGERQAGVRVAPRLTFAADRRRGRADRPRRCDRVDDADRGSGRVVGRPDPPHVCVVLDEHGRHVLLAALPDQLLRRPRRRGRGPDPVLHAHGPDDPRTPGRR